MSIFRVSDYARKPERIRRERLPTQDKTRNYPCSHCESKHGKRRQISEKEFKWLCDPCWQKFLNKNSREKPHFLQASKLWREK